MCVNMSVSNPFLSRNFHTSIIALIAEYHLHYQTCNPIILWFLLNRGVYFIYFFVQNVCVCQLFVKYLTSCRHEDNLIAIGNIWKESS